MKKRLLITSIVMMLVVAVALSTATYAWFTRNAAVNAQNVVITAATSDAQSISIGWYGSETKGTFISSPVLGDSATLTPMCFVEAPTVDTTTAAAIAFHGQSVEIDGKFSGTGETKTPYTWTGNNGTANVGAFYVNNDSNSQAVSISVSVDSISNSVEPTAMTTGDLLEGSGKVYYKKDSSGAYTELHAGTASEVEAHTKDYVANVTTVSSDLLTTLGATGIYTTKGVEDYVRVAVFATTAQSAALTGAVAPENYTYKGLLAKNNSAPTAAGAISSSVVASSIANAVTSDADNSVVVIKNLPKENRVYIIVKVWLDGPNFTQAESGSAANVNLTFSAGAVIPTV